MRRYSTGCTAFQQWQSEVLLYTARKVGQRGKITHIVTGCEDTDTGGEKVRTHQSGYSDRVIPADEWRRWDFFAVVVYRSCLTSACAQGAALSWRYGVFQPGHATGQDLSVV